MREGVSIAVVTVLLTASAPPPQEGVRGEVCDASGACVPDAEVLALASGPASCCGPRAELARTRADGAGRFELRGVRGPVRLVARRDGDTAWADVSSAGPHVLRFSAPAWIEGVMRGGEEIALEGARVIAHVRSGGEVLPEREVRAVAGARGLFRLGPVAAGTRAIVEGRAAGFRPRRIVVEAPAAVSMVLERGVRIAGVVFSAAGPPLAGVIVEAGQGDGFTFKTMTAPDGSFVLDELGDDLVRLVLRAEGYESAVVDADVSASPLPIVLRPCAALEGRIEPARPGLFAVVVSGRVRCRVPIGEDGRFRLNHVPRGLARLDVETAARELVTSLVTEAPSVAEVVLCVP
ncbi:MAG: carboxypeptidase regulatory-like domain-containing protein [Planctomycetes bacterium]|nr:carboxypeptidase regulatory-like domain-containing protein [Planctomycetota bacterium]